MPVVLGLDHEVRAQEFQRSMSSSRSDADGLSAELAYQALSLLFLTPIIPSSSCFLSLHLLR